jgi:hypothetical protein
MMVQRQFVPLSAAGARALCDRVRRCLVEARQALEELHRLEGWRALGYRSWRECCESEFGLSQRQLYRHLVAVEVERDLGALAPAGGLPESHARPLAGLSSDVRREVYGQAAAAGPVTASTLHEMTRNYFSSLPAERQLEIVKQAEAEALARRPGPGRPRDMETDRAEETKALMRSLAVRMHKLAEGLPKATASVQFMLKNILVEIDDA